MTRLAVLEYPDPRLRAIAAPVREFGAELARLVDDMLETMLVSRAIGLAAPQVGVPQRIVTVDASGIGTERDVFVNPELLELGAPCMVEESCLSVPGVLDSVERAIRVRVRYRDVVGQPREREIEGLAAVCLQHEIDHLDGRLFIDRLPLLRRLLARRRVASATAARRSA